MKERPVLMTGAMVRASMREVDPKQQTRRIVKPQPVLQAGWVGGGYWQPRPTSITRPIAEQWSLRDMVRLCPYGAVGDRLWVRETFQIDAPRDGTWHDTQWYGCKGSLVAEIPQRFQHPRFCNYKADWLHGDIRWRPGIHMPRWASRITLKVTEVRVERLQDITEADALAEGVTPYLGQGEPPEAWARTAYRVLWNEINGPGSWDRNDWVWVISFRRLP